MRDRLTTAGAHRYDLQFHFAPEAQPMGGAWGDAPIVRAGDASAPGLEIFAFGTGGKWRRENGWVSRCYGERVPAPLWIFSATGEGPREFITFLVPRAMQNPGCRVPARGCGEVEAVGGGGRDSGGAGPRAFVVEDGSVRDVLLIGGGQLSEAVALASDFEWTWGRFERDTGRLKEIVLIGGRRLILDGRDMLDAAERVGYMTARYAGEELFVETDASGAFTLACASVSRVVVNGEAVPANGATAFRFGVGAVAGTDSKWTKAQV